MPGVMDTMSPSRLHILTAWSAAFVVHHTGPKTTQQLLELYRGQVDRADLTSALSKAIKLGALSYEQRAWKAIPAQVPMITLHHQWADIGLWDNDDRTDLYDEILRLEARLLRAGQDPWKSQKLQECIEQLRNIPEPLDHFRPEPPRPPQYSRVYFIRMGTGPLTINTTLNMGQTLRSLQEASPFQLQLLHQAPGGPVELQMLEQRFRAHKLRGPWYRPGSDLLRFIELSPENLYSAVLDRQGWGPVGSPMTPEAIRGYLARTLRKLSRENEAPQAQGVVIKKARTWTRGLP